MEGFSDEKQFSCFSERGRETTFPSGSVPASIAGTIPQCGISSAISGTRH